MKGDATLVRRAVTEMSNDELRNHIIGVRDRRMKSVRVHKRTQDIIAQQKHDKIDAKLCKQTEMLEKALDQLDKKLEAVEKRALTVETLRIELEGLDA